MTPERKQLTSERDGPSLEAVRLAKLALEQASESTPPEGTDREQLLGAVQEELRNHTDSEDQGTSS